MPCILIEIRRDSVCLADDMQDHRKTLAFEFQSDLPTSILSVARGYLPIISGNGHSWSCFLNGENVAIIDGNCKKITTLISASDLDNGSKLYFKYHAAMF